MVGLGVCDRCKAGDHCHGSLNLPSVMPGRPGGWICVCAHCRKAFDKADAPRQDGGLSQETGKRAKRQRSWLRRMLDRLSG